MTLPATILLAELLRLQRYIGGDSVPAARIFGLMHGFESVVDEEKESYGISRQEQEKIERLLQEVEDGKQSSMGMHIKQRMIADQIDESKMGRVLQFCRLESRFVEAYERLTSDDSHFSHLKARSLPEHEWFGATHYIELHDCTEDTHKKLHACFATCVPRAGETILPPNGSPMRVVNVQYEFAAQGQREGQPQNYLVPFVLLEPIEDQ